MCKRLNISSLRSVTGQGYLLSGLLFNIVLESLDSVIRPEKEITSIQIGKVKVKQSLVTNNIIIHVENLMESTKKLLELVRAFSKVEGYKITIQKPIAFLYTNNE